jgi:hypothetical protein
MGSPSERFQWLAQQFDALVERLSECKSLEERKQLLRRMMILIHEIDALILSALTRDKQGTTAPPNQPTTGS